MAKLDTVPTELLLKIIPRIPFSTTTLPNLCLINRRFHDLIVSNHRYIILQIAAKQLPGTAILYNHPSSTTTSTLPKSALCGAIYQLWLLDLVHRDTTISTLTPLLHTHAHHCIEPAWTRLITAGQHLLYHLSSQPSHAAKLAYISSLPLLQLAIVYTTTVFALSTAQILGIPQMTCRSCGKFRAVEDVAQCFEECTLKFGPDFLYAALVEREEGDERGMALVREEADREQLQGTLRFPLDLVNGVEMRLFDCLREEVARKSGCEMGAVSRKVWDIAQAKGISGVGMSVKELVNGPLAL